MAFRACCPEAMTSVVKPALLEIVRDEIGNVAIVFDDQDVRRHPAPFYWPRVRMTRLVVIPHGVNCVTD